MLCASCRMYVRSKHSIVYVEHNIIAMFSNIKKVFPSDYVFFAAIVLVRKDETIAIYKKSAILIEVIKETPIALISRHRKATQPCCFDYHDGISRIA